MTKVVIEKKNGHVVAVTADGHTGYGVEGEDIVCAALSSVMQTALLGLMRVAGISVKYTVYESEGRMEFSLPDKLTEKDRFAADMILETMLCGIADLNEGYSDFIELEVK